MISKILYTGAILLLAGCAKGSDDISMSSKQEEKIVGEYVSQTQESNKNAESENTISITIGDKEYLAVLYDNETAKEFQEKLPFTAEMEELNGNEKYYYYPDEFSTNTEYPGSINKGDIMLYGNNCIVVFYESFSTSYGYTKIGYIEDASDLDETVGSGNVEVTFNTN
jgi:hypothetical protein